MTNTYHRDRALLHFNKLDTFVAWATTKGFRVVPVNGLYETLRLRKDNAPPLIYYHRDTATEHVTCFGEGLALVKQWIRERRN